MLFFTTLSEEDRYNVQYMPQTFLILYRYISYGPFPTEPHHLSTVYCVIITIVIPRRLEPKRHL
jgi:hypothetical protein